MNNTENNQTATAREGSLQRRVSWHRYDGGFWLRIGTRGRGFAVADKEKHPPLFSERYGYRKVLRMGKWGFEILKPANTQDQPRQASAASQVQEP